MKSNVIVSIVIAVYNAEKFIEACIDSITSQSFRDFEVICVDDCSPDRSGEILRQTAERDPRFKILTNKVRCGGGASRNRAMREATGEFIYFMDPDDQIHHRMLECALYFADKENADVVCFSYHIKKRFAPDAQFRVDLPEMPYQLVDNPFFKLGCDKGFKIFYNYWTKLYRRSALGDVKFLEGNEKNPHIISDFYHSALALSKMHRCVILREKLYSYTVQPDSASHKLLDKQQIQNYRYAVNMLADELDSDHNAKIRRYLRNYTVLDVAREQLRRLEKLAKKDPGAVHAMRKVYRAELWDFLRRGLLWRPGLTFRQKKDCLRIYWILFSFFMP